MTVYNYIKSKYDSWDIIPIEYVEAETHGLSVKGPDYISLEVFADTVDKLLSGKLRDGAVIGRIPNTKFEYRADRTRWYDRTCDLADALGFSDKTLRDSIAGKYETTLNGVTIYKRLRRYGG